MLNPGDLYVFDTSEEVGLEWLVVRFHPDDETSIQVVPIDDFPLVGTPDLTIPHELVGRIMNVRGGESDWFPSSIFLPKLKVASISQRALKVVQEYLAKFVRGQCDEKSSVTYDPEYEEWIGLVAQLRVRVLALGD